MKLNKKINLLRKEKSWTMQELADRAELSKGYISMLEKGENPQTKKPIIVSLSTAQNLAHAFGLELEDFLKDVEDNISLPNIEYSKTEQTLANINIEQLSDEECRTMFYDLVPNRQYKVKKLTVREYIAQAMETGKGIDYVSEKLIPTTHSIITGRKSAAGEAIEVDDDLAEEGVITSSLIPKGANELVEITGDSMEPLIHKGEKVFIRHQPDVENGEVAIIRIDDQGVTCKRVYKDNGQLILRSENDKYDDIVIEKDEVAILAKVLLEK